MTTERDCVYCSRGYVTKVTGFSRVVLVQCLICKGSGKEKRCGYCNQVKMPNRYCCADARCSGDVGINEEA